MPRSCTDNTKCFRSANGTCKRPNPWVEYLFLKGGTGATRAQLKRGYPAWKRSMTSRKLCNLVRRRGGAHNRNIEGNVCEFWQNNSQVASGRVVPLNTLYHRVVRAMQKGSGKLTHDFDYTSLTVKHAYKCVKLVDRHFYGNKFDSLIDGWEFSCDVVKWEGVGHPSDGEVVATATVNKRRRTYELGLFQSGLYNLDEDLGQFEGITPRTRLTLLVVAVAHEMAHVLATVGGCQERSQHSEGWDQINRFANGLVYTPNPIIDVPR